MTINDPIICLNPIKYEIKKISKIVENLARFLVEKAFSTPEKARPHNLGNSVETRFKSRNSRLGTEKSRLDISN